MAGPVVAQHGTGSPDIQIQLLGGFSVRRDGSPVPETALANKRARTLLKLLAIERGRHVSSDRIAEMLWGDDPPQRPADNIAVLVSRLRRVLGADAIVGGRHGYALAGVPVVRLDLVEAEEMVAEAEFRLSCSEPALAATAGTAALGLLGTGAILPGEYADWLEQAVTEASDLLTRARHAVAEASLQSGDPATGRTHALAALEADAIDEPAVRQLMRAHLQLGEPARALAAYESLRGALADSLGVDPAPETRDVHLAVLRERQPASGAAATGAAGKARRRKGSSGREDSGFVGREAELAQLTGLWSEAAAGMPSLVLVAGEAGIGKTRLVTELSRVAETTGGVVLSARCYETERSLFLQPVIDALEPAVAAMTAPALRDLVAERTVALATLFPQLVELLGAQTQAHERGSADNERRQSYDAVTTLLTGLSRRKPVLLILDDVQHAGLATIELLHYVARHSRTARLLVVATLRAEEGRDAAARLAEVAQLLELGPLSTDDVARLADRAGLADSAQSIMAGTQGHPLFVVETIQGLAAGDTGIPSSLRQAILARVARTGAEAETLLRAASVLGTSFEPQVVAGLLQLSAPDAARRCEQLLTTRLVVVAGRSYEFAHDLVHEVLYATTPPPTRLAYHRAAADLLADRPEAAAAHAAASEDWPRAGRAWLLAAEQAVTRYAGADAERLLGRALDAAEKADDTELRARVLVARGRVREVLASYADAETDLRQAVVLADLAGDHRVKMRALRLLGGDVPVAGGQLISACLPPLYAALAIAESLADRAMEADVLARLAVLAVNELKFVDGVALGARALAAARASGDSHTLAVALDGAKVGYAYLGDIDRLAPIVSELEVLVRRSGDAFLLHWAMCESAFIPMARGQWDQATALIGEAQELGRRSGWLSSQGWFEAHLGWIARLQGNHAEAIEHGRRSLASSAEKRHTWWDAFGRAMLAISLAETGATEEATTLLREGLELAEHGGTAAYRLRCLAALAQLTGDDDLLAEADAMLDAVSTPDGQAWLHGIDVYVAIATAHLGRSAPERASEVIAPALDAARTTGSVAPLAQATLLQARIRIALGDPDGADSLLEAAESLAESYGMTYVAQAAAALRHKA
ncbi:MAG: AAA family ATPase [Actinomycetota bacterium]